MSTKALAAKLSSAANRLQPALRLIGQIRQHIDTGSPAEGGYLAKLDCLAADLEAELFSLEASVGVVTQPSLFEETGCTEEEADQVPASASITFLVDCDHCGQECEAAGNRHLCEHCGKEFDIDG